MTIQIQLPNQPPSPKTVCGGDMTNPLFFPSAEYRGAKVYFCRAACLRAFESDPDRFIRGEIEHPKEDESDLENG